MLLHQAQYCAVGSLWVRRGQFLTAIVFFLTCDFGVPGNLSLTVTVLNPNLPFVHIVWTQAQAEGWFLGNPFGLADRKGGDLGNIPANWGQAAKTA